MTELIIIGLVGSLLSVLFQWLLEAPEQARPAD